MTGVSCRKNGAIGHITLNRPKALHSLTRDMCEAMSAALLEWRNDPSIAAIILDHAEGTRGFCAGGDVVSVRTSALEDGGKAGRAFFQSEYRLNHLLFTFPKPTIAFMDGVTMGGGVGLSLPCRYRVATQNTLFAMPEGAIGLFPDVGAGYYLPRLPGQIGKFLALTGARLDGAECLWAGLASHYLESEAIAEAKARILADPSGLADILGAASTPPPPARLSGNAANINRLFAPDTLEGIIAALDSDDSKWAGKELAAVTSKCPTSAKVALKQIAQCPEDFAAEMAIEYRLAVRMIIRHDFVDGVRAVLVDKDNAPQWQPALASEVDDDLIEAIFAPLPEDQKWTPFAFG